MDQEPLLQLVETEDNPALIQRQKGIHITSVAMHLLQGLNAIGCQVGEVLVDITNDGYPYRVELRPDYVLEFIMPYINDNFYAGMLFAIAHQDGKITTSLIITHEAAFERVHIQLMPKDYRIQNLLGL